MNDIPSLKDEYREAGEFFRKAFTLLFDIVKLFLTFNVVLGGIIAFIGRDEPLGEVPIIVSVISLIGAFSGIVAIVIYRRMNKYVESGVNRAALIEQIVSGVSEERKLRLYTEEYQIHKDKKTFTFRDIRVFITKLPTISGRDIIRDIIYVLTNLCTMSNAITILFLAISVIWSFVGVIGL